MTFALFWPIIFFFDANNSKAGNIVASPESLSLQCQLFAEILQKCTTNVVYGGLDLDDENIPLLAYHFYSSYFTP